MSYISTVNNKIYRVDTGENASRRDILIEEAHYSLDWYRVALLALTQATTTQLPAPTVGGRYSLIIAGKSYEVFARRINKPGAGNGQTYEIELTGQHFEVQVEDEREKALAGAAKSLHELGEVIVHAPMPGLVLDVPLEIGASVARGETVLVLEAMKMENDLAAPRSGTIKEVRVNKGQTVNQGDVLVVITGE